MMGHEPLRNIALLQGTQVAAIFEPDPEMARTACALTPGAHLVGSIAELLAVEALDSLVITSPNFRHLEQLEEIAATRPLPWMRGVSSASEMSLGDNGAAVAIGQAVQRSIATGQAVEIAAHPWLGAGARASGTL